MLPAGGLLGALELVQLVGERLLLAELAQLLLLGADGLVCVPARLLRRVQLTFRLLAC